MQTIKQYILENYELNEIKDIVEHGCVSGSASGLIYYNETVAFHDAHEDEIWDMLSAEAQDFGCTEMELIAQFNGQKHVGSMTQLKNLLAWYAVEETCRAILDENDNNNE